MNKRLNLIAITLFFIFISSFALAEDKLTITTYYPSPYGSYNELETNTLQIKPRNSPLTECGKGGLFDIDTLGKMYTNTDDKMFYYCDGTDWRPLVYWMSEEVASKTLVASYTFTGDFEPLGGGDVDTPGTLAIKYTPTQSGLFAISWSGKNKVKVDASEGKYAKIRVTYNDNAISEILVEDDVCPLLLGDCKKDKDFTRHDVTGSALVQLKRNNTYTVKVKGKRSGDADKIEAIAEPGFNLKVELVLVSE